MVATKIFGSVGFESSPEQKASGFLTRRIGTRLRLGQFAGGGLAKLRKARLKASLGRVDSGRSGGLYAWQISYN